MKELLNALLEIPLWQSLYVVQVIFEEALFAVSLKKKNHFALRLSIALTLYFTISLAMFLIINPIFNRNLCLVFFLSVGLMFVCFENRPSDIFFSAFAAVTIQNLAYNVGLLICILLGISPDISSGPESKLIQAAAFFAVNIICYFVCIRKVRQNDTFGECRKVLTGIATVIFLVIYILEIYLGIIGMLFFGVVRMLFIICDIMVLFQLFWIVERYRAEQDRKALKSMISNQYQQFEIGKKNLEIIHMKEHDLKHVLTVLRKEDSIRQSKTFQELEESAVQFEKIIKTGNQTMDIILTDKNLLCSSLGITMTYMIDPDGLDLIQVEDMAAIFGNLLDNAIRYLQTVKNPEQRLINLRVQNVAGMLIINAENFFESSVDFCDGLPITTQEDQDIHGFGLKSIRYLVEKYGGAMSVRTEYNTFIVNLTIPINN